MRQDQAHRLDMKKAKASLTDKKSLSVDMPSDSIRRLVATGLGAAKAASDLSNPVTDTSARITCLGADWTNDSPESFGLTALHAMFDAVHGLRTAAEIVGFQSAPTSRMIFHLARVDFGGSGFNVGGFRCASSFREGYGTCGVPGLQARARASGDYR